MKIKVGREDDFKEYCEKNSDFYGKGVVDYANAWANLMEKKMDEGATIQKTAKQTSHDADTQGITGFMYGCAVQQLAYYWEHGEELRKWHNLDCQIGTEGEEVNLMGKGVLNPAIINIKVK